MGEEYTKDKFNLLTICFKEQIISDLWERERHKERKRGREREGEGGRERNKGGGRGSY